MQLSLRAILLFGFTVIIALIVFIVQIYSENRLEDRLLNIAIDEQKVATQLIKKQISVAVLEKKIAITNFAQNTLPKYFDIFDIEKVQAELEQLQDAVPAFSWIGMTDLSGNIIAGTDSLLVGQNAALRPWFLGSKSGAYVGDIHDAKMLAEHFRRPGDKSPIRFTDYAHLVFNSAGDPLGVVVAHASVTWIDEIVQRLLDSYDLSEIELFLSDSQGRVIYPSTQLDKVLNLAPVDTVTLDKRKLWGDRQFLTVQEPVFIEHNPLLDWVIVTRRPTETVFHLTKTFDPTLGLSIVGLVLIAIFFVYFLLRKVLRPLHELSEYVAGSVRGEEDPIPTPTGRVMVKEIEDLFASISAAVIQIKAQRDALQESQQILEVQVEARTLELSSAFEELRNLHNRSTRSYATVAHELRTPVAAINMMTESEEAWSSSRLEISELSEQLMDTLDDMRLAINPALKRPIKLLPSRIGEICRSVASMLAPVLRITNLEMLLNIEKSPDVEITRWQLDTYRLRVAISNLIKNACFHSKGTQVLFGASVKDNTLVVEVSDNGVGIPVDKVKEMFEPYSRGNTEADGTGMGLYITQSWIDDIGGTVTYESLNPGSKFIINLPLGTPCDSDFQSESDVVSNNDIQPVVTKDKHACFIDDDMLLRTLGKRLLDESFAKVDVYSDGNVAIQNLEDVDLLITDLYMPDMDGRVLISNARKIGFEGYVVALTGADTREQIEELYAAGADLVMLKPLNKEKINQIAALAFSGNGC